MESTVAVTKILDIRVPLSRNQDIKITIVIYVAGVYKDRVCPTTGRIEDRCAKRAVCVADQDRHCVSAIRVYRKILHAIAIPIPDRKFKRSGSRRIILPTESAITVTKQDAYRIGAIVGTDQIQIPVSIEVARLHDARIASHRLRNSRLEGAVAIPVQNGDPACRIVRSSYIQVPVFIEISGGHRQ
nr:hypothetical protein [Cohnella fermenti]